jgi:hypothetical protein
MSTELLAQNGIYLTRFYGGTERGTCYQITTIDEAHTEYIALTSLQMAELVEAYVRNEKTQ